MWLICRLLKKATGVMYRPSSKKQADRRVEVLAERLPDLIAGLKFERSMRWNSTNIAHSRPLRWLVALHGPMVVPFGYAGVQSGRTTQGLRPYGSPAIEIAAADDYRSQMMTNGIVLSTAERQAIIESGAAALAASKGGQIPADQGLLDEVTNLVERPTPFIGAFEERFLALPPMVLVAVMRKHQRYFPVYKGKKLLPYFIAVRNGDEDIWISSPTATSMSSAPASLMLNFSTARIASSRWRNLCPSWRR